MLGISADTIVSEQKLAQLESVVMTELCMEFGYNSMEALLSTVSAADLPDQSRIKDLNGDKVVNAYEAQYVLQFVNGMRMYENSYTDLDATGDYIVNEADAFAYLQYYAYYSSQGLPAPFSSSNGPRTVDYSYEYRTYVKCDYPSMTTATYTLNGSGLLNANGEIALLPESGTQQTTTEAVMDEMDEMIDEEYADLWAAEDSSDGWTPTYDTRIVRIGQIYQNEAPYQSAGFIIGDHLIATAGHTIYNYNRTYDTGDVGFNPYRQVWACTYKNGIKTEHLLTVKSVHINYIYATTKNTRYDYGLIEVEEDLSDYGYFSFGMFLDEAIDLEPAMALTVQQFQTPKESPSPIAKDGWLSPELPSGEKNLDYKFCWGSNGGGGLSGSVVYSTSNSEEALGIKWGTNGNCIRITRPLFQFYLNNPYIN